MFSYFKKKKEILLFLLIIVFALFFIQIYKESKFTDTFFGKVVFFFAIPSQEFSSFLKKSTISFAQKYVLLKNLSKENGILKRALEKEKLKNIEIQKIQIAYNKLRESFLFSKEKKDQMLLGEIIGDITDSYSKILIINRGTNDGILKNQSVLHASGIVGKILQVDKKISYVQLITDKKSYIPIRLQRNRDRGILYGQGKKNLTLRFIPLDSKIKKGDIVVSSGIAGIHTKDFPIGRIKNFRENVFFYSIEAVVEPFANFSKLEFVFINLESKDNAALPLFQNQ